MKLTTGRVKAACKMLVKLTPNLYCVFATTSLSFKFSKGWDGKNLLGKDRIVSVLNTDLQIKQDLGHT